MRNRVAEAIAHHIRQHVDDVIIHVDSELPDGATGKYIDGAVLIIYKENAAILRRIMCFVHLGCAMNFETYVRTKLKPTDITIQNPNLIDFKNYDIYDLNAPDSLDVIVKRVREINRTFVSATN